MELVKLFIIALLVIAAALALALNTSAQDCTTEPDGTTVCVIDGRVCLVQPDGTLVCRDGPPMVSPVGAGLKLVFVPVVIRE